MVRSGFEFPLGIESVSSGAIQEGYSVDWVEGGGDGPDTFTFFVVLSHSRLSPLLHDLFALLPEQVSGIVEMGSRDAFRSVDIFSVNGPSPARASWIHGRRSRMFSWRTPPWRSG